MTDPQFLSRPDGTRLAYCATPARDPAKPGILFCGGFRSDMTGTKAVALEEAAKQHGLGYVRFDYFGHGQSDGDFLDGSIGRWKEDTLAMLREVCAAGQPQILVGSSMGGWLATLAALAMPDRTAGLVLIAPALDFTEDLMWAQMTEAQRAVLLRDGILREPSQYSDQPYEYTLKLITEGRDHMILKPGIVYDRPVRILQGMMDPDVPYQHAVKTVAAFQGADTRLTLLRDGDHRLSRPQDLELLIATVLSLT